MKMVKIISLFSTILTMSFSLPAQKQSFDIISYTAPEGWTETVGRSNVSYSRVENGNWAQIAIYKSTESTGTIDTDFDKEWTELVAASKNISSPQKTKPQLQHGWTVMSGSGIWQYNGATVATILTLYSNNNICIAVFCNSTSAPYLKDYQFMLGTIDFDISKIKKEDNSTNTSSQNRTNHLSVIGTWDQYVNERGTTGYFRSEYVIKADGTYLFLRKDCSAIGNEINFNYETGTWKLNGNQLTITPKQGKDEVLEKPANGHWGTDWGKLLKSGTRKLETTTYTIKLSYDEYYKTNYLRIDFNKPTQRDGGSGSVVFHKYDEPYLTLPHKLPK